MYIIYDMYSMHICVYVCMYIYIYIYIYIGALASAATESHLEQDVQDMHALIQQLQDL